MPQALRQTRQTVFRGLIEEIKGLCLFIKLRVDDIYLP
jgi:hypothetical protein